MISEKLTHKLKVTNEDLKNMSLSLKRVEDRYECIRDISSDAILEWDIFKDKTHINKSFARLLELTREDQSVFNIDVFLKMVHPDDFERVSKRLEETIKTIGREFEGVFRLIKSNGEHLLLNMTGNVLRSGDDSPEYFIGVAENITKIRHLEMELEQAKYKIVSIEKAKENFVKNVGHEVRTPMNSILSYVDFCIKNNDYDRNKEHLKKIAMSTQNLLGVIKKIIDFSKIDMDIDYNNELEFRLDTFISELVKGVEERIRKKGLVLVAAIQEDVPLSLIGDKGKLALILNNLLDNARKFTARGEILLEVKTILRENDNVKISFKIKDTGIGIAEDKLDTIFDAFMQVDNEYSKKYSGMGTGLAIVKRLIESMDGNIEVKSKIGEGSIFTFTIDFKISKESESISVPSVNLQDKWGLIVSDNHGLKEAYNSMLKSFGMNTESVDAFKELMEWEGHSYDLIYVDIAGYKSIDKIKETVTWLKEKGIVSQKAYVAIITTDEDKEDFDFDKSQINGFYGLPLYYSKVVDDITKWMHGQYDSSLLNHKQYYYNSAELEKIKGAEILVVEDSEINRQIISEILSSNGFVVSEAVNGKVAIEMIKSKRYDLVLMDINMPVLAGDDAIVIIREDNELKDIPIVAITANDKEEEKNRLLKLGMSDFVEKPIKVNQLFNALLKWIKARKIIIRRNDEPVAESKAAVDLSVLEFEGINVDKGLTLVMGKRSLYNNLIEKFYENNKSLVEDVTELIENKNWKDAAIKVHGIKGVAGNIGAMEVFKSSNALEAALKNIALDDIFFNFNEFKSDLDVVMKSLGAHFEGSNSQYTMVLESENDDDVIDLEFNNKKDLLRALLDDFDTEALEMIEEMLVEFKGRAVERLLVDMKKYIANYDFDSAIEILKKT